MTSPTNGGRRPARATAQKQQRRTRVKQGRPLILGETVETDEETGEALGVIYRV